MKPISTTCVRHCALLVALALCLCAPGTASAAASTDRIVVGIQGGAASRSAVARQVSGDARVTVGGVVEGVNALTMTVDASATADITRRLEARPDVSWVEPDFQAHSTWYPGDPQLPSQWALAKLGAWQSWETARGSGVRVAVVDTGVDYLHPDLAGRVDQGWDFVDNDANPMDEMGHGTHVAGIVAAAAGNGVGGSGFAPAARVFAVRALDRDGSGYYSWIASAIVYSADQGAQVINLSLGGNEDAHVLEEAVGYATAHGALVTCASGNDGAAKIGYPARYQGCFSVGASTSSDTIASFSNRGRGLDVVAPGANILSSTMGGGYEAWDGTSMATPVVSGVAALLVSQGRSERSIEQLLRSTSRDLGAAGWDSTYGAGRVDASAAVAAAARLGAIPADDVRPAVGSLTVGPVQADSSHVRRTVWRRTRVTRWRIVGVTDDMGSYAWSRVKKRGNTRRTTQFRARRGVVRSRVIVEKLRTRVDRRAGAVRLITAVDASDNRAVDRVSLEVDGHWVGTDWSSTGGWSVSWACSAGNHTYLLRAFDARNNAEAVSSRYAVTC